MASSGKTSKLGLNQWSGSDPVMRTDFNADNSKLDLAVTQRALIRLSGRTLTSAASSLAVDLSSWDLSGFSGLQLYLSPRVGATVTIRAEDETPVSLATMAANGSRGIILYLMLLPGGVGGWWMAPGATGTTSGAFQFAVEPLDLCTLTLGISGAGSFQAGTEYTLYGLTK